MVHGIGVALGSKRWVSPKTMTSQQDEELMRVIQVLKDHLGITWKQVARELNFSRTDIDAIIVRDAHDLKEQIHSLFHQWRLREGNGATVQKLLDAVKAAGLQYIIDEHYRSSQELDCSGTPTTPLQESSATAAGSPVTPTSNPDLEHIRQKRLVRLDSNKSPTTPKLESAERTVSRTVSTASNSSTTSEGTVTTSGTVPTSETSSSTAERISTSALEFEVGDVVKVEREPKPWYGVIRWTGPLKIHTVDRGVFAGIEMEELVEGGHSGKFDGRRYFTCEDGYGLILPVSRLKRDDRFPTLKAGPTPTGEDAERDDQMPSASTSNKANVEDKTSLFSFTTPLKSSLKEIHVPTESSGVPLMSNLEGVSASSRGKLFGVECPGDVAGFVIGKDGKNLREVESKTDTNIHVDKDKRDKTANTKILIEGDKESCKRALLLILQNIRRKTALHTATTETITIPNEHCGRVVGKNGVNLHAIQDLTGARIKVPRKSLDTVLNPKGLAKCEITGSSEQIAKAKELVSKAVEGCDIAQNAFFAAFVSQELKAEGSRSHDLFYD